MRGNIRELSKGRWEIRYDLPAGPDGKRRQKSETVRGTKTEANRRLREILGELDRGSYIEPSKLTTGEFLLLWLRDCAKQKTGRRAFMLYELTIRKHLNPALGSIPLAALKPLHIQAVISQKAETLAPSTVDGIYKVLTGALKQAVKWELLARNPAEGVEKPKITKGKLEVYDDAQIAELLRVAAGTVFHLPILIAVHTGLRLGELCALKWEDIDFERKTLRVDESIEQVGAEIHFKGTKNGEPRTISISDEVVKALLIQKGEQAERRLRSPIRAPHDLVWPKRDGSPRPPIGFSNMFGLWIRKQEGLPVTHFHTLRHYHAVVLLQKLRVPLKVVADRLGHKDPTITLGLYGNHAVDGLDREAAESLGALLKTG